MKLEIVSLARKYNDTELKIYEGNHASTMYLGKTNVYKVYTHKKIQKKDHFKERFVLQLLQNELPQPYKNLIPIFVGEHQFEDAYVQVHARLVGKNPKNTNKYLANDLGKFLYELHKIAVTKAITEFDKTDELLDLQSYIILNSSKYAKKLRDKVSVSDNILIDKTIKVIKEAPHEIFSTSLNLIHKDLSLDNVLMIENKLTGIVDWEAAQTGPAEWEFAILLQRFPDIYNKIVKAYDKQLNTDLIRICGLVQSLRYWKGFPDSSYFVGQQKKFIKFLLD